MVSYNIPAPQEIPFFDHDDKNLRRTIANSSRRRNMSPWRFAFRKIKNIILYRLTFFCPLNSWRIKMHRWRGIHIGENVYIGQHCILDNAYPEFIFIEDKVSLAGAVTVIAHTNPYAHFAPIVESRVQPTIIKKGAWIGINSIILAGVTVGENAIVTAGSVVDKAVAAYTLVQGNPAKKVTEYEVLFKELNN